jgi:hypothetical protein
MTMLIYFSFEWYMFQLCGHYYQFKYAIEKRSAGIYDDLYMYFSWKQTWLHGDHEYVVAGDLVFGITSALTP